MTLHFPPFIGCDVLDCVSWVFEWNDILQVRHLLTLAVQMIHYASDSLLKDGLVFWLSAPERTHKIVVEANNRSHSFSLTPYFHTSRVHHEEREIGVN